MNQQSLDQRDCAQTGVRLKKETVGGGVARLFYRVVLLSFLFLVSLFLGCLFVKGLDKKVTIWVSSTLVRDSFGVSHQKK